MAIAQNFPKILPTLNLSFALTKALDPRITFARASAATYYGTETAKAEENLLLRSQEFETASWSKVAATVSANASTAPDGTSTADKMEETAVTSTHFCRQDLLVGSSQLYVFSIFAKADERDVIRLQAVGGGAPSGCFANFNLTSGTVGTVGAGATAAISNIGNDWYRCQITLTTTSSASTQFIFNTTLLDTDNQFSAYLGVVGNGIFVWGAQLEQRDAVTNYTPTTNQPITNFVPVLESAAAGEARFDHNPVTGESLGLLIEESRTNLLLRSEEFDDAGWSKVRSSIVANTIVAPSGELTGDKLVEDTTASNTHGVSQVFSFSTGSFVYAIYAKAGERTFLQPFRSSINIDSFTQIFNLAAGTVAGTGATIVSVGNGWFRCSGVVNVNTAHSGSIIFGLNNGTSNSYTGDGFSGIFLWGASLEQGAFPTSYVKTTTAQVTRAADAASMTGANFSSWFNQAEGSFYSEHQGVASINQRVYALSNGTVNNTIDNIHTNSVGTGINFFIRTNAVNQITLPVPAITPVAGQFYKLAGAYQFNNAAASRDGGTAGTSSSVLLPVVDRFFIGKNATGGAGILNGHIRKIAYYPKRIANDQLQALTS